MNTWVYVGFVVLWVITFLPAWKLLLKLVALSVAEKPNRLVFVSTFVIYRMVILLPYIFLLVFGEDLPNLLTNIVIGIVLLGIVLSVIRFFFQKQATPVLWRAYSYVYDGLLHFYPYQHLLELVAQRVKTGGSKILDAGCGTGNLSAKLLEDQPGLVVTAVDSSSGMIKRAKKKLSSHTTKVRVYEEGIIEYLKRNPQEKFDTIALVNVLYALDNRQEFWRLCLASLKENGQIVVTNSDRSGSWPIIKEHLRNSSFLNLLRPRLLGVFLVDLYINQLEAVGKFEFLSQAALKEEISAAGGIMRDIERCYGGTKDGVNLLFTVSRHR